MKFLGVGADEEATTTPTRVLMMTEAETFMVMVETRPGL